MADTTVIWLGRDVVLSIYTGGQYVQVKGLTEKFLKVGKQDADITTDLDLVYDNHLVARRNAELSVKGHRLEDDNGDADTGQAAVEALAEEVGASSIGKFKLTFPSTATRIFNASAAMDSLGGANDDGTDWGCTLKQAGDLIVE